MALWLLSLSVFCLVGWTSSGSALGCYLSVRWVPMMGWTRTNFARIWVEDEQATNSKVKSFEEDNLKPEKTTCRKLFEGPYSSRCCFTQFNTCSNCFTKIIASSTFAKITPSRSVTKIMFSDMQRKEGDALAAKDARLYLHSRGEQLLGHAEQTRGSCSADGGRCAQPGCSHVCYHGCLQLFCY